MEGKRIVRRPVPNSARTKPPSNGLEGATSSKPIDRSTLPKDRLLYAQSQTIRSRGTKTRKWSKRASIPEHTHVHTYTRDILDPGSVVERDQKRDQRFGKGTRPAKGYRAHAVRDTNVPRFPIGRWPSADSARHGVARGLRPRLHHRHDAPLPLFDKRETDRDALRYVSLRVNTIRSIVVSRWRRMERRKVSGRLMRCLEVYWCNRENFRLTLEKSA